MEFSFNMTAQDYYTAWKIKNKIINKNTNKILFTAMTVILVIIAILSFFAVLLTKNLYLLMYVIGYFLLYLVFIAARISGRKRTASNQFNESAVLQSMHTIRTYSEGLEIINSYEKMFVPWKSIYYVSENDTHFIILPTYAKGIIAIDKSRFASPELDRIKAEILSIKGVRI